MCHLLSISPSLSNGDELDMDCLLISSYVYSINKVCASLTLGEERSTFKSSNLDNLLQICWLCSDGLEWPSIESADLDDLILFSKAGFWHAGRWWVGMPKKNFSLAEPWWVGALWMGRIWLTWVELKLDTCRHYYSPSSWMLVQATLQAWSAIIDDFALVMVSWKYKQFD